MGKLFFSAKVFSFSLIGFFAVVFLITSRVQAQDVPAVSDTSQKTITVATVNVQDIGLIKKDNNVFTITFNITNREGVQPKVIYAVNLLRKDSNDKIFLIDQKIYDNDIVGLGANDSIHKEIAY